jgi:predicted ATPase
MLLKKYSDFGGGKTNLIQSFCHNLMLNSGKKFVFCTTKKININSHVVRKKNSERKKTP